MPIQPGTDIGRYHILEQLGEGGMAVVYKAYDTQLEREVALKVLRSGQGSNDKFIKRFKLEARALAKLNHPNIVKILDYGEQDGLPYLVMEYVPGQTLKQKIGKPMDFKQAAAILAPIADALAYAHEHKILHRDVKPSNILIKEDGTPLLSDFGIAKMLELDETLDLTGTGVGMGTPEYMAPELGLGEPGNEKADQYSLGIVFFELVTGRKPFRADTPLAVLRKHTDEPLPRPRQYNPDLPENVERVLFKALAKNPKDRFDSILNFSNALKQLSQGEKVGVGRVASQQKSRRQMAIAGIFVAMVLIILVTFFVRGGLMNTSMDLEKAATLQHQATYTALSAQMIVFSTKSSLEGTQKALTPIDLSTLKLPSSLNSKFNNSLIGDSIFEEKFEKNDTKWNLEGSNQILNQRLILNPGTATWPNTNLLVSDFIFEAVFDILEIEKPNNFSVCLRWQYPPCSGWNCSIRVAFDVDNNLIIVTQVNGSHEYPIKGISVAGLKELKNFKIIIVASGKYFYIYINNNYKGYFFEDKYSKGRFLFDNYNEGGPIAIQSIKIYHINETIK